MLTYPAKLLLFGEYTVIKGGSALAVPYAAYQGSWQHALVGQDWGKLQEDLPDFVTYLESLYYEEQLLCKLDIDYLWDEVERGLFFESTIPRGYGVGSSGALCAALYDRFVQGKKTFSAARELQKELAQLESFFHGSSSGMDPLVAYLNEGLLFKGETIEMPSKVPTIESQELFLVDSGRSRETAPLVELFLDRSQDEHYAQRLEAELMPYNETAIQAYLAGDRATLFEQMHLISHFQWKYFAEMIPKELKDLWLEGLSGDRFKLKLCGAGGGGFLLGMGEMPALKK